MYRDKKVSVIIVAAGRGNRFGGDVPQQFREIDGQTVRERAVLPFEESPAADEIIVVTGGDFVLL